MCGLTYITSAVHFSELVQMRFDGSQVLLLHVAEQTLDSQGGHLQGGGGIHGGAPVHHRRAREKQMSSFHCQTGVTNNCYCVWQTQHRAVVSGNCTTQ